MNEVLGLMATSGFLGMLVGGLLTHRFSLARDRRKERIEALTVFWNHLLRFERSESVSYLHLEPYVAHAEHYLPRRTVKSLERHVAEYNALHNEAPQSEVRNIRLPYDDKRKAAIRAVLKRMIKTLKPYMK
ncbi:TPA: hypothetical protein ACPJ2P_000776 [Vibrio alginolyticus]|uniref:hypothetical protein n=1 Tax=Vibrio diabolicus TaxID=50719 RepID=UPI000CE94D43|nr:hypothetical protein [Vibrio diabolicus]AVF61974.1 hypothetical protein AL537_22030 [Vibrio diabolicus]